VSSGGGSQEGCRDKEPGQQKKGWKGVYLVRQGGRSERREEERRRSNSSWESGGLARGGLTGCEETRGQRYTERYR